jgi:predicted DNA-binding transcriptional regulator AlpA
LSVAQGDKVLAAALLGIGKTTIYRTLENGRF